MEIDSLLALAWQIAEHESRLLGSREIEPIHFLLGALKIVDPEFPNQLEKLDLSTEDWKAMCKEAVRVRHYLDIMPDKICQIRRRVRRRLARTASDCLSDKVQIHRSRKSRAAFFDAQIQLEGKVVTLLQLMRSMFELDFLDVSEMRWRGTTRIKTT